VSRRRKASLFLHCHLHLAQQCMTHPAFNCTSSFLSSFFLIDFFLLISFSLRFPSFFFPLFLFYSSLFSLLSSLSALLSHQHGRPPQRRSPRLLRPPGSGERLRLDAQPQGPSPNRRSVFRALPDLHELLPRFQRSARVRRELVRLDVPEAPFNGHGVSRWRRTLAAGRVHGNVARSREAPGAGGKGPDDFETGRSVFRGVGGGKFFVLFLCFTAVLFLAIPLPRSLLRS